MSTTPVPQMKLEEFLTIFQRDIAPRYREHERTFDPLSIHGRLHILRCLFLADHLCSVYEGLGHHLDRCSIFHAVAFHDIGRQDNGIDLWEQDSANACRIYLGAMGYDAYYAERTAQRILKPVPFDGETQVLYDVDVLDYMRFFTFDDDAVLFEEARLHFLSWQDVITRGGSPGFSTERRQVIQKALDFARKTEDLHLSDGQDLLTYAVSEAWA